MPTVTAGVAVSADDGSYDATTLNTTRGTETWVNGNQFIRFQSVAVPVPRRCVVDSATLTLTGALLSTSSPTVSWTAQRGSSAAISSGADATARVKTSASVSYTFQAGALGAVYHVPITAVIAEAVGTTGWTSGAAITLFGVRTASGFGLTPMQYFTVDAPLAPANEKPRLTIVWHPAGDAKPGVVVITGVRTGRKNARGRASGILVMAAPARTGRKGARGAAVGTARLIGARTGRTGRQGAAAGGPSLTFAVVVRAGRRGGTAGRLLLEGGAVARPARRGRAAAGSVVLTGQARGGAARKGAAQGAVGLTGDRAGRTSRRGQVHGTCVVPGLASGRPAHLGSTAGGVRLDSARRGLTHRAGGVAGTAAVSGTTSGRTTRTGSTSQRVTVTSAAAGISARSGRATGVVGLHGWITDADSRFGVTEGQPRFSGRVTGIAEQSGGTAGALLMQGTVSGRAGKAGRGTSGVLAPPAGQSAVRPGRGGEVAELGPPITATNSGLAGRSGEVQGWASLAPGQGAGTLTGQTGRCGACVGTSGTPSGLAAGAAQRTGRAAAQILELRAQASIGRAGRASSTSGAAATSGAASGRKRTGGRTAAQTTLAGHISASRSDATTVHGRTAIGGAVRGKRAAGGRALGTLRLSGVPAAVASRQGRSSGELPVIRSRMLTGSHGGRGAVTGRFHTQSRIDAPVDLSGRVAGRAVLRGRYTGTRLPPAEVVHTVFRVPPPIIIPTVPASVVRTNPITVVATTPSYRAPVPVTAKPQVTTTVKASTPKRGVVTRG